MKLNDLSEWEGRDNVYLYASAPTPSQTRYVFGPWVADLAARPGREVCLSEAEAADLIEKAWEAARERADEAEGGDA